MSPIHCGGAIDYGNKSSAPTSPAPTEGSMYYHTGQDKKYLYNGSAWQSFTTVAPYTGGAATHWWTQAGLTGNDGWMNWCYRCIKRLSTNLFGACKRSVWRR